jgi:rSAM/selenodomain-associated transferase 2
MRLAIVIPTLDEEPSLRRSLSSALDAADEVVISDGGSTDGTLEVARARGVRIISGPPGRGGQLNRGAAAALEGGADVLLFLHADTTLPEEAGRAVRDALAEGAAGGAFLVRFDVDSPEMRLGGWLVNHRTRLTRLPLGDQAQFVTAQAFRELGGYRDWPILEDVDFARRLKRRYGRKRLAMIESPVTTAARRFAEQGSFRTVATNWLIWLLYLLGVSPHRLAGLYRHIR